MSTVGKSLQWLRENKGLSVSVVARAIKMTSTTYLKVERDQREASFIMIYRLCAFYEISMHEFADMLSSTELGRSDLSTLRVLRKRIE
jgi:transcriptional regulator with XRE-family HTH domain